MDVVLACVVGVPVYHPPALGAPSNDNSAPPMHHVGYRGEPRRNLPRGYQESLGPPIY